MTANHKMDTLIAILSLSFVWSHSIGEWLNEKVPIVTLKHGRKAQSLFLYGLEYLSEILLNYEFRGKELLGVFERLKFDDFKK